MSNVHFPIIKNLNYGRVCAQGAASKKLIANVATGNAVGA